MRSQPEYIRLCRLIDDSLRPYKISELSFSITKHTEKHLLIALSHVSRQIKIWTDESVDFDSDNESIAKPYDRGQYSICSTSNSEDHHCLTRIVTELVLLLAVESRYVQHIAENVLVAISEFLAASVSCHDEYIHVLGLCLELSTYNCLGTMEPLTRFNELNSDSSTSFVALKLALESTSWPTVAGVIYVMRNILKHLKKDSSDQLLKGYFNSIRTCLSNIPWDLFNEIYLGQNCKSLGCSGEDTSVHDNIEKRMSLMLFSGNLVQFFCSLAAHGYSSETSAACLDEQPVACIISDIISKVLAWCLRNQGDCYRTCTSHYSRHKILKLMIRLTYTIHLECRVLVSWLNIVGNYFRDLLSAQVPVADDDQYDCLEGSPFLMGFIKGSKGISSHHLQRLAVFLFMRCSLSLVSHRDSSGKQCVCANMNSSLPSELNWDSACCNRKQGLLELYQWFLGHLPPDSFVDSDIYIERCTRFALSFLRLYMHEDDILFKVLLQLFWIPLPQQRVMYTVQKRSKTSQEVEDEYDMLCLVSDLLNPICLFHLFLAELLYDHQVLLDYLISKDTGASSAEYLLRCLRAVCDSWNFFVEFTWDKEVTNHTHKKKRKVLNDLGFQGGEFSAQREADDFHLSHKKGCMTQDIYSSQQLRTTRLPFEDVMECLLLLKNSVLNLHKKSLFPYNPDVLLRRLKLFEELCCKQRNMPPSQSGNIT